MVQLTLQCLERDPSARLDSGQLEEKMAEQIQRFAGVKRLHCAAEQRQESKQENIRIPVRERNPSSGPVTGRRLQDRLPQPSPNPPVLAAVAEHPRRRQRRILLNAPVLRSPINHTSPSATTTSGTASISSLLSLSADGLSDTVVNSPQSREKSVRQTRIGDETTILEELPWPIEQRTTEQRYWDNWHNNHSQVDPRLSLGDSVDAGAVTYLNYSTSTSSDEGIKYFPQPPPDRPPKPPPTRGLPPVPVKPSATRLAHPNQLIARRKASTDDGAAFKQPSK